MKRFLSTLGLVLICSITALSENLILEKLKQTPQISEEIEENSLRMICFNIHGGVGMDKVRDYQRIADVINEFLPDVIAVQEVDSVTKRSEQVDVLQELAMLTQMFPTFAPAIHFSGGKYGIGLLSKEKPITFRYLSLPGTEEERVLLIAEFQKYIFANIHLSLTEADRMASIEIIKREASKAQKPFFLAGDWNAQPNSDFVVSMQEDFILLTKPEQHTFPADIPDRTIDYIAVLAKDTVSFRLISAYVVDEPLASDHRPLVVDVLFLQPKKLF